SGLAVKEVSCIELNSWFGCPYLHHSSGSRIGYFSNKRQLVGRFLIQNKSVVVATTGLHLFFICVDAFADLVRLQEIERCSFHGTELAGWYQAFIDRQKFIGVDSDLVIEDITITFT